jgi:hypothetical protein
VFPLPAIELGKDTSICVGTSLHLSAGNYSSYLWHDNSPGSSFIASQPGKYFVTVSDNNNCQSADTINVISFKSAPTNFLPSSVEFCRYDQLEIKTIGNFVADSWSTGSTAPAINVSTSGRYSVRVTNSEGCSNTDSIVAV